VRQEVARLWNKAPAIWFPSQLGIVSASSSPLGESGFGAFRSDSAASFEPVARNFLLSARLARARGDERLSGNKHRESDAIGKSEKSTAGAEQSGRARKDVSKDKGVRKQRASDLGRALRSIYDDTLRETVPDDFKDLLGKLS
jgi:hypothetical protein